MKIKIKKWNVDDEYIDYAIYVDDEWKYTASYSIEADSYYSSDDELGIEHCDTYEQLESEIRKEIRARNFRKSFFEVSF